MNQLEKKVARERETIEFMIRYSCKKQHHQDELCTDCEKLLAYANERITRCPFKETKTFCSACKVHCYEKTMRQKVRDIMRFSGPRMLFHHPVMALHHLYIEKKEKRQ